jgi:hypothetical protein
MSSKTIVADKNTYSVQQVGQAPRREEDYGWNT